MAIIKKMERIELERDSRHTEVDCTYSVLESEGKKLLQIDTYGSKIRKIPGKKSQSLRFSPEAIRQLKEILKKNF
jgi:hypothetical protein